MIQNKKYIHITKHYIIFILLGKFYNCHILTLKILFKILKIEHGSKLYGKLNFNQCNIKITSRTMGARGCKFVTSLKLLPS